MPGFENRSIEERKKFASMGGKAAWQQGKAHRWTPEEARLAGMKGGKASKARRELARTIKEESPE